MSVELEYVSKNQTSTYVATYSFSDNVEIVGSKTISMGTTSTNYDIVTFGDWPQTIKDNSVSIDETQSITRGVNTYYVGSDGNYYAKVIENAYEPGFTYSNGAIVSKIAANSTKYFKVEPIKWRILTKNYNNTGKALLLAENILTSNIPFYEGSNNRTIDNQNIYANNYKHSQIRAFLNGIEYQGANGKVTKYVNQGFLQTAFNETAISKIVDTAVDNSVSSITGTGEEEQQENIYVCENTNDKIFLLAQKEVTTQDYGFGDYTQNGNGNVRIKLITDYAKTNHAYQISSGAGYWWLRSPSSISANNIPLSSLARRVSYDANANDKNTVYNTTDGIAPALVISID